MDSFINFLMCQFVPLAIWGNNISINHCCFSNSLSGVPGSWFFCVFNFTFVFCTSLLNCDAKDLKPATPLRGHEYPTKIQKHNNWFSWIYSNLSVNTYLSLNILKLHKKKSTFRDKTAESLHFSLYEYLSPCQSGRVSLYVDRDAFFTCHTADSDSNCSAFLIAWAN